MSELTFNSFTIPRVAGWLAHWRELVTDPNLKIFRPRQKYTGYGMRDYVDIEKREPESPYVHTYFSQYSTRRNITESYWNGVNKRDVFDSEGEEENSEFDTVN